MMACVYVTSPETLWPFCLTHLQEMVGSTDTQVTLQILSIFFTKISLHHSFLLFPFLVLPCSECFQENIEKQKIVPLSTLYE